MRFIAILTLLFLTACNYMHVKPNTMEPNTTVYVERNGGLVKLGTKKRLEKRGYKLTSGMLKASRPLDDSNRLSDDYAKLPPDVSYILTVKERSDSFFPIWCFFNGFWWERFHLSVVDNQSGEELLLWSGRGCINSTMRKFEDALDELEKK